MEKTVISKRVCPVCSSPQKIFLYKQDFNNVTISLMGSYDVVTCVDCGFVYADQIPSQDEFNDYYEMMSKYEYGHKAGVVSPDHMDYFIKVIDFIAPYLSDENARILDIGCSTGTLLSLFKAKGYANLLGVDPSLACVESTKKLHGIDATVNNISNFIIDEKFDVIILSAVLEHVVDLQSSMLKIWTLLKNQGWLFIAVPDAERFDLHISAPFQQFSIEHINYFSRYSIENLLSKFSFKIIDLQQRETRLGRTIEPDIFILSRKENKEKFTITKDGTSCLKIRNYITKCLKVEEKVKKIIREKLAHKDKIIVWGVGTHTLRLLGLGLESAGILYFVDSNIRYVGKKLNGIEIKSPGDIESDTPILISTYSYQEEIIRQIRAELKLNNEIITIY